MAKTITLREANQGFARCIREVEAGEEFVVTRNGAPVARIVPVSAGKRVLTPEQEAAWKSLKAKMERGVAASTPWKFNRDEIYEERVDRYKAPDDR